MRHAIWIMEAAGLGDIGARLQTDGEGDMQRALILRWGWPTCRSAVALLAVRAARSRLRPRAKQQGEFPERHRAHSARLARAMRAPMRCCWQLFCLRILSRHRPGPGKLLSAVMVWHVRCDCLRLSLIASSPARAGPAYGIVWPYSWSSAAGPQPRDGIGGQPTQDWLAPASSGLIRADRALAGLAAGCGICARTSECRDMTITAL